MYDLSDGLYMVWLNYLEGGLLSLILTISIVVVLSINIVQRAKNKRIHMITTSINDCVTKITRDPATQPTLKNAPKGLHKLNSKG